ISPSWGPFGNCGLARGERTNHNGIDIDRGNGEDWGELRRVAGTNRSIRRFLSLGGWSTDENPVALQPA
ncbi:MAG: hypothetical protein ACK44Q_01420, partial [Pirellulaceae bacterium]